MNRASSTRFKQDALIALGILIVLLLLWRLLRHQDEGAGFAHWVRLGVFGSSGTRLAGSFGGSAEGLATPMSDEARDANRMVVTTNTSPLGSGGSDTATNLLPGPASLSSNPGEKIIAGLDTNDLAPLASSPDAAAIAQRLSAAGAKGGDIQFSLFWRNYNDLDLHCIDPKGVEIYFSNLRSPLTGGELDIDRNASPPFTNAPIENIYWPSGHAPAGIYLVGLVYYAQHDRFDATPYTVRTVVKDKTNYFNGVIAFSGPQRSRWICRIQYDPQNPDPSRRARFLPLP